MIDAPQTDDIRIALVAAVAENGVIGRDGDMPWRLRDDLAWFKKNTLGKPILMGRKTLASIGKALPGRDNIVITRDVDFRAENVLVELSIETALATARKLARAKELDEICVIGGGEIYRQTLDLADRLYLTRVHARLDGDTVFPALDAKAWTISPQGGVSADERNSHACSFYIFERR